MKVEMTPGEPVEYVVYTPHGRVSVVIHQIINDRDDALARERRLREACQDAQCACSPSERESGHLIGCWFPELQAALAGGPWTPADHERLVGKVNVELGRRCAAITEQRGDLLAACKSLLRFAEGVRPGGAVLAGEAEMFSQARDAIARAEGGGQ